MQSETKSVFMFCRHEIMHIGIYVPRTYLPLLDNQEQ